MAKKRHPAMIQQEKQKKIEDIFKEVIPLIKEGEKDTSSLKKDIKIVYQATKDYISASKEDGIAIEACMKIYRLFKIKPWKKWDISLTNLIKDKLRLLKYPQKKSPQLDLFAA